MLVGEVGVLLVLSQSLSHSVTQSLKSLSHSSHSVTQSLSHSVTQSLKSLSHEVTED